MGLVPWVVVWIAANGCHSCGYFLAARLATVSLDRVSLGFGLTLWSTRRGHTTYRIALFPVAIMIRPVPPWSPKAQQPWPPSEPHDIRNRSLMTRWAFAMAPVAMVAICAFASAFYENSLPRPDYGSSTMIDVVTGLPAAKSGLQNGDHIQEIDGTKLQQWSDLVDAIARSKGAPINVKYSRAGQTHSVNFEPMARASDSWAIGVRRRLTYSTPPDPVDRIGAAASSIAGQIAHSWTTIVTLFSGSTHTESIGGPVAIYNQLGGLPADYRMPRYRLALGARITVVGYLLLCLLPFIPYLDGSKLLFLALETICRRRIHPKYSRGYNRIALAIVLLLNLVAFAGEIRRSLL